MASNNQVKDRNRNIKWIENTEFEIASYKTKIKALEKKLEFQRKEVAKNLIKIIPNDIERCAKGINNLITGASEQETNLLIKDDIHFETLLGIAFEINETRYVKENDYFLKIYKISGQVKETKFNIEIVSKLDFTAEHESLVEEYHNIANFRLEPETPYDEELVAAMRHDVNNLRKLSSFLMKLEKLTEFRTKVLEDLGEYSEFGDVSFDDSTGLVAFHVFLTTEYILTVGWNFVFSYKTLDLMNDIKIKADSNVLIRYSQHPQIEVLKGNKQIVAEDLMAFFQELFDDQVSLEQSGHEPSSSVT